MTLVGLALLLTGLCTFALYSWTGTTGEGILTGDRTELKLTASEENYVLRRQVATLEVQLEACRASAAPWTSTRHDTHPMAVHDAFEPAPLAENEGVPSYKHVSMCKSLLHCESPHQQVRVSSSAYATHAKRQLHAILWRALRAR